MNPVEPPRRPSVTSSDCSSEALSLGEISLEDLKRRNTLEAESCLAPPPPVRRTPAAEDKHAGRPLCLDYLNGNCHLLRPYCRYYHPKVADTAIRVSPSAVDLLDTPGPICEVWALTGFCKFGEKCWKRHPEGMSAEMSVPVAEPMTRKFTEWLQLKAEKAERFTEGRLAPVCHAPVGLLPTPPPLTPAGHVPVRRSSHVAPAPLPSYESSPPQQDLPVTANAKHALDFQRSLPAADRSRFAAGLRDTLTQTLQSSVALPHPRGQAGFEAGLRAAGFLGQLATAGLVPSEVLADAVGFLLQNLLALPIASQRLRAQLLAALLSPSSLSPGVPAMDLRRQLQWLADEVPCPEVARTLRAIVMGLPPAVPPAAGPPAAPIFVHQPYRSHPTVVPPCVTQGVLHA